MAKKPPPVVVEPSGVFVKVPLTPSQAALASALLEQVATLFGAGRECIAVIGKIEGEATRALSLPRARKPSRPRARRR